MAYIVDHTKPPEIISANISTATPSLPPPYSVGDMLMFCLTQDGGGVAIAVDAASYAAGWRIIDPQAAYAASRQVWAYKIMTSSDETMPTFTGSTDSWSIVSIVVRDVDQINPIHSAARGDWSGVARPSSAALTTTVNNCLIIMSWGSDGSTHQQCCLTELAEIVWHQGYAETSTIGWRNQYYAGDVPTCSMQSLISTEGGNTWTIAINNVTNGSMGPEVRPVFDVIRHYDYAGRGTWSAPNSIPGLTEIAGVPLHTVSEVSSVYSYETRIETVLASEAWVGGFDTFDAPFDIDILSLQYSFENINTGRMGALGTIVVLVDSSNNWAGYLLLKPDKYTVNNVISHIDTSKTPLYSSTSQLDKTDVVKFGVLHHRIGTSTTKGEVRWRKLLKHGSATLIGGGQSFPATMVHGYKRTQGWQVSQLMMRQGDNQIVGRQSMTIGDGGSSPTYFVASGDGAASFETPRPYDYATQPYWQVELNRTRISLNTGPVDTISYKNSLVCSGQPSVFDFLAAASSSAIYVFDGAVFSGLSNKISDGREISGCNFERGSEIDGGASTLAWCTISQSTGTHAIALDAGGSLTGTEITKGNDTYGLNIREAGAYNLSGAIFNGYDTDIHVTATSGTVTITLADGQAAPTYVSDGATVVIAEAATALTISAQVSLVGAEVRIYDLDTSDGTFGTELSGTEAHNESAYTYNGLRGNVVKLQIMLSGFVEYLQTVTLENAVHNLDITLSPDINS